MKKLLPSTLVLLSLGVTLPLHAQSPAPLNTQKEKFSYALGMNFAQTMKAKGVDIDPAVFNVAMKDVLGGGKLQLTDAEAREAFMATNKDMLSKAAGPNKTTGAAFLAANKAKPGVQTLPDGLQYKVLTEGSGASPKPTDKVTVKYTGSLINGTVFDSSDKQPGGSVAFPVNGVIPGWTEALQKMKVGAKWQLFIPSELAYGDAGTPAANGEPPAIAPGSTLLFDVELVKIGE